MNAVSIPLPLYESCGFVDLSSRGKLEFTGDDRAKFLHNLSTNEIKGLPAGSGCEAFLLDAKGHVQFYVIVHNTGDRLLLEELAPAGETTGTRLFKHFDKYLMREKVVLKDQTCDWAEFLVAGAQAAEIVGRALDMAPPSESLGNCGCPVLGEGAFVARSVQATAPNFTIFCSRSRADDLRTRLEAAGVIGCDHAAAEAPRIEAGLPLCGVDITDKNLAQEIDRVERTISFRKGCYLGQETVARLDALGHVNKSLVVLMFAALAPGPAQPAPVGTELQLNGQTVGQVTSSAVRHGITVALAYVRRGSGKLGTILESPLGSAEIVGPLTSTV